MSDGLIAEWETLRSRLGSDPTRQETVARRLEEVEAAMAAGCWVRCGADGSLTAGLLVDDDPGSPETADADRTEVRTATRPAPSPRRPAAGKGRPKK